MARKIKLCKEPSCSNQQTTLGYCRLHYLKNWKKVKAEKQQKAAKNLNRYIEGILKSNPDGAVATLRGNLRNDEVFTKSLDEVFYRDSFREVMNDLGYRDNLDQMIDSIKIDETF